MTLSRIRPPTQMCAQGWPHPRLSKDARVINCAEFTNAKSWSAEHANRTRRHTGGNVNDLLFPMDLRLGINILTVVRNEVFTSWMGLHTNHRIRYAQMLLTRGLDSSEQQFHSETTCVHALVAE